MAQDQSTREKVTKLIDAAKVGMLTTMTQDGQHHSRPMRLQETEFDGDLWFFTYESSNKVTDIALNPQVNIAFSDSGNTWISLSGTAKVVDDKDKANELWSPFLKSWFPDGLETKGLTLIKLEAQSAEYWDAPNSKAIQLFGMAKATLTGTPPKAGDNQSVDL